MRHLAAAAVLLSSTVAAAQAPGQTTSFAADPGPEIEVVAPPQRISYRGHIHLADGMSLAAMVAGGAAGSPELTSLGFSGLFLGAPIVHVAHGRPGAALKSLGLRTALPMLGALAGYRLVREDTAASCSDSPHAACVGFGGSIVGLFAGFVVGGVAAAYIDGKYLASYEVSRAPSWAPNFGHVRGGMTVGISGSF